ncbi:amidase [Arthrobacter sp. AZCC_0090]|uniref:amidase n=1 Tax=Arthrobacter sp. AZCC_0090 TaxID=2735881 RepID=UPI0017CA481B|nr:amidase [Arthrobacter sp. AZCC_0090]MBB6406355.1 Asp-tRNA(Asn)/Glu-tRNA(Gln) amidotransferase A subunit family amidase [Arthrobacter sp. AZCC_0090]
MSSGGSLRELSMALASGAVTPSSAVEQAWQRMQATEPEIRAWAEIDAGGARFAARELERSTNTRGPLWGVPVGVKDLIDVQGLPTRCGSVLRGGEPAGSDADCVKLLRQAGAVVMGKTVTTEFGYFAPGPTRNPANRAHTPGGSSSGSAAAVAAGMVPLAIGTQTAGSLTRPASFCGVAGFVAPKGQFSMSGVTGLSPSLDSLGFLARTVTDLHLAWSALIGDGPASEHTVDGVSAHLLLWNGRGLGEVSADMATAVEQAVAAISHEGVHCEDWTDHDIVRRLADDHATIMAFEAARERSWELQQLNRLSVPLAELLATGATTPEADYVAALYRVADARWSVEAALEQFDAILGPAALGAAPAGIDATGTPVLSRPWQALGLPVITIPGLRDPAGMPLGLQLIGSPGREHRLFSIAERIEAALALL